MKVLGQNFRSNIIIINLSVCLLKKIRIHFTQNPSVIVQISFVHYLLLFYKTLMMMTHTS